METALLTSSDSTSASLKIATVAYLARFKGLTRKHIDSDLRAFFAWCQQQKLDPFDARRPHIELYLRWMQEVARYKPSTVSRRLSVVAGFYRICVIDAVLPTSPAEYVRRPRVPSESPTLGLNHLQFEAMSIRFTEHLELEGIAPSIGSVGDAYDNALMESIIGLFKTECIATTVFHDGPYKTLADVEYATAGWVDWYNHRRLHGSLGMLTPTEYEQDHYAALSREPHPV